MLSAMVLAAGYGTRLLPLTKKTPKPLIVIDGISLLDRTLNSLEEAGVKKAIVNVHWLGNKIIKHLQNRKKPEIIISEEENLLDSAGSIIKVLPHHFCCDPFFVLNADTFWLDSLEYEKKNSLFDAGGENLKRMFFHWENTKMDILLLLVKPAFAIGHSGGTDFLMDKDGRLTKAKSRKDLNGWVYGGAAIIHPRIFSGSVVEKKSLNFYFEQAILDNRLFGIPITGTWITISTPETIAPAQEILKKRKKE